MYGCSISTGRAFRFQNTQVDRCALYQYRLAVAYANGTITDSEKLKWWNWKD
ncbi:MAG: helix-hairpin-helix domain-containing protein [Treponema sp.]|nr:helix-hairpin-helix domain-containing protein [Treponema sp.]